MKQTVSVETAAQTLGIGKTKLYDLLNAKALVSFRIGRRRLILAESVSRLVDDAIQEGRS